MKKKSKSILMRSKRKSKKAVNGARVYTLPLFVIGQRITLPPEILTDSPTMFSAASLKR